jgi:hypothetical protein
MRHNPAKDLSGLAYKIHCRKCEHSVGNVHRGGPLQCVKVPALARYHGPLFKAVDIAFCDEPSAFSDLSAGRPIEAERLVRVAKWAACAFPPVEECVKDERRGSREGEGGDRDGRGGRGGGRGSVDRGGRGGGDTVGEAEAAVIGQAEAGVEAGVAGGFDSDGAIESLQMRRTR